MIRWIVGLALFFTAIWLTYVTAVCWVLLYRFVSWVR